MSEKKKDRRGLGRGLGALIGEAGAAEILGDSSAPAGAKSSHVLAIDLLRPNPDQPRRSFREEELDELAASIEEHGIIQPIVVRPDPVNEGQYQIVAGERRWRAAQRARIHEVPVLIRELSDQEVMEIALVENIQRSDLSPVEEASAYKALIDRHGYTQEALGKIVGKSRSHIANMIRLLSLPGEVLELMERGELGAGHARALIGHPEAVAIARKIAREGLTARDAERLARQSGSDKGPRRRKGAPHEKDADTVALEEDLSAALRRKVRIEHDPASGRGRITLEYSSLEDLDDLCAFLTSVSLTGG